MKRIFFFTDTPIVGGAELQMFLLAKFLPRETYECTLVCLGNPSLTIWTGFFEHEGIRVIRLPFSYKNDPRIFFELRKILEREKPDLFHIHLWNPASGRFAFLAAKSLKIPYLVTEHDPFRLNPVKRGLKRFLTKPKAVIAISKENREFLRSEYGFLGDNIFHVPNGIDVKSWETIALPFSRNDRQKIRNEIFGLDDNGFAVINVATLHERKGQETLLRAVSLLLTLISTEEKKILRIFLTGDGEHRKKFEALADELGLRPIVQFLGQRNDIPWLLLASDLFVLPSHREGFGLAILEAGMAKLPVIGTRVGGIQDIIENEKDGLLIPPKNEEALARAILELFRNPEKRLAFGSALYEKVVKNFRAETTAERTAKVYDTILKSPEWVT